MERKLKSIIWVVSGIMILSMGLKWLATGFLVRALWLWLYTPEEGFKLPFGGLYTQGIGDNQSRDINDNRNSSRKLDSFDINSSDGWFGKGRQSNDYQAKGGLSSNKNIPKKMMTPEQKSSEARKAHDRNQLYNKKNKMGQ